VLLRGLLRRYPDGQGVGSKTITFKIDGTSVGTPTTASDGTVSVSYTVPTSLAAGNHTLSLAFAGDVAYNAANTSGTITIRHNTLVTTANVAGALGQPVTLKALL